MMTRTGKINDSTWPIFPLLITYGKNLAIIPPIMPPMVKGMTKNPSVVYTRVDCIALPHIIPTDTVPARIQSQVAQRSIPESDCVFWLSGGVVIDFISK
jgi:hypothetical protein